MNLLPFLPFLVAVSLQSSASASAATPSLPFGDINVVVLTDTHSWVGGHKKNEPTWNADYGDVYSFHEQLKAYCDESGKDLWFVMNGDWIDGTGLALNGDPSHLIPLLEKMPWDVVNVSSLELVFLYSDVFAFFLNKTLPYLLRIHGN